MSGRRSNLFGSYLALAFEQAGLDLTPPDLHDAWSSSSAVQQVKRAPGDLHFAAVFRSNPGLDLAPDILDGESMVVGVEEFRFSRAGATRSRCRPFPTTTGALPAGRAVESTDPRAAGKPPRGQTQTAFVVPDALPTVSLVAPW